MQEKIYFTQCTDYNNERIYAAVKNAFEAFGGVGVMLKDKKNIVIKPNLVLAKSADNPSITHHSIIEAVVHTLTTGGVDPQNITIAESPGGPYVELNIKRAYNIAKLTELAAKTGVRLNLDLSLVNMSVNKAGGTRFPIIKPIAGSDYIINICKLKTHGLCLMSAAVKNLYGCIGGTEKVRYHSIYPNEEDFAGMLLDLCGLVRPNFSITDAVTIMEGNGPTSGTPRHLGAILAAENPYASDFLGARLLGFSPSEVKTVRQSVERGLCGGEMSCYDLAGGTKEELDSLIIRDIILPDAKKSIKAKMEKHGKLFKSLFNTKPVITKKCVGCGACAVNCPSKIISVQNKAVNRKAVITDRGRCIQCYCCQEMCPAEAIDVKRSFFLRLLK